MLSDKERAAQLGKKGEELVAAYLKSKGYIIVKRNWRDSRYGEIDIIAENSEYVVFVEVKTRTDGALVSGLEAVDEGKMRRTKNAALSFMRRLNTDLPPRIDVAEVTARLLPDGKYDWNMKYIKSAF